MSVGKKLKDLADDILEVAQSLPEKISDDRRWAREAVLFRDATAKLKELKKLKDKESAEIKKMLARVDAAFDPTIDMVKSLAAELKDRVESYAEEKTAEQTQLLDLAAFQASEGYHDEAAHLIRQADAILPSLGKGVSLARKIETVIENLALVPDDFVVRKPKLAYIRKMVKNGEQVPGVTVRLRARISARSLNGKTKDVK